MNMKKIRNTEQAWDDRTLGAQAEFVGVADVSHEEALQEALELQAISIRLPKELVRNYKLIADFHGIGYQPLMRDVLQRFVAPELKHILETQHKTAKAMEKPALIPRRKAA
jgi:predicted DNA binding CopG/RHH family protein